LLTINLGTGNGYSVLEVLHAFEKACGKAFHTITDRRPGDVPVATPTPITP
jgi:UDP-glucose 4-epimerase